MMLEYIVPHDSLVYAQTTCGTRLVIASYDV